MGAEITEGAVEIALEFARETFQVERRAVIRCDAHRSRGDPPCDNGRADAARVHRSPAHVS